MPRVYPRVGGGTVPFKQYFPFQSGLSPPKRVEGRTFEFSFPLPGTAKSKKNSPKAAGPGKNTAPKTPKDRAAGTSSPPKPDDRVHHLDSNGPLQEIPSTKANDTRRDRQAYDQDRRKTPERREYHRRFAQQQRQKAKELGKCRNCGKPAILSQTRCHTCAKNHRQSRRSSDARRRAEAKGGLTTEE